MWYYESGSGSKGPVSAEEVTGLIRSGVVSRTTRVWRDGFADWKAASETELGESLDGPPPIPNQASTPAPRLSATQSRSGGSGRDFFQPLDRLAQSARWGLIAFLVVSSIALISNGMELGFLNQLRAGDFASQQELTNAASANDARQGIVSAITIIVLVVAAVLFFRWTHRACKNLYAIHAAGMTITPGWAVGWYFIPVMQFWKPYQAIMQIVRASRDPKTPWQVRDTAAVSFWWFLWIVGFVVDMAAAAAFAAGESGGSLNGFVAGSVLSIVANGLIIAAAAMLLGIVGRVTRDQEGLVGP